MLSHQWAALAVVLAGHLHGRPGLLHRQRRHARDAGRSARGTGAIEWVVAGYGLTFAAFLITAGRLGDQLGRRRMFSLGLALFTLASAACGLAPSPAVLVGARLAQGLAAALLSPQVLSIIGVVYNGPDRVRAISIYGIVLGLAAVGGQLIGGVLVQADIAGLGWRSCFLINVPDRPGRPGARRARACPSRAPRAQPPGPGRHRAGHARPRRHRAAARRGPPARLAGVDVAVPRRRARSRSASSPPTSGA